MEPHDVATAPGPSPCCAPLGDGPFSVDEAAQLAERFKAIADPVRLRMLGALAVAPEGICVCDFVDLVDRRQPTVSHHLKVLHEAGLVAREQRGRWAWYSLVDASVAELRDALRTTS